MGDAADQVAKARRMDAAELEMAAEHLRGYSAAHPAYRGWKRYGPTRHQDCTFVLVVSLWGPPPPVGMSGALGILPGGFIARLLANGRSCG